MIAIHCKQIVDSDGLAYSIPDERFRPFRLNASCKGAKWIVTCPNGHMSPWTPCPKDVTVICHCPSSYSPHIFVVKKIKSHI